MLKRLGLRLLLPALLLYGSAKAVITYNLSEAYAYIWDTSVENKTGRSNDYFEQDTKQRGMSVFGWGRTKSNIEEIEALVKTNTEWVAVIPFFYQQDEQTIQIRTPEKMGTWTRRDSMFIRAIKDLHDADIHVQLKPHLWMSEGWRSNINLPSDADWNTWFESYRINMLHYAKMANETGVELLCIGTELETSIENNPNKWNSLISEIKEVYSGKLTYAANWDHEYKIVPFWDQMDYIGIQAYFPLTTNKNPTLEEIRAGWQPHIEMLENFSKEHKKPILFTEIGYKSESSATIRPWEWHIYGDSFTVKKSFETQRLAYEALFLELWRQEWFAGLYIWQWNLRSTKDAAHENLDFTPRFKPAENEITKWFGKPLR